jgi:glycine betaine/choline ABC-type transport system substrate-binding protein
MLGACTSSSDPSPEDGGDGQSDAIVVGSFDFSESRIIAEAYTLALEDAGYPVVVRKKPNEDSFVHSRIGGLPS